MTVYNEKFFKSWLSNIGKEYDFPFYLDQIKFCAMVQDREEVENYKYNDYYPIRVGKECDMIKIYDYTVEKRNGVISIIL